MEKVYEHDGDWGGTEVYAGPRGWHIFPWSAIQGETSGGHYFVKYSEQLPEKTDLEGDWNKTTANVEALCFGFAGELRCIKKGHRVQ